MTDVSLSDYRTKPGRSNITPGTLRQLTDAIFGDEDACLWCGCKAGDHAWTLERTRWFEPYDPARHGRRKLWTLSDGTLAIERTSHRAQVQVIYCHGCAERLQTAQVICYIRPRREGGGEMKPTDRGGSVFIRRELLTAPEREI